MSEHPNPERGSERQPMPQQPTPPTGGEPMQDHAPPQDASAEELIGQDSPDQGDAPDGRGASPASQQNPEKDVQDWATGDEPMTGPQRSYLQTLAREAGRDLPEDLTKGQASKLIDELQAQTGRGR